MMILAAALLLAQEPALDDFYKFKTGTSWSYKRVENGVERRIDAKVTGEDAGRVKAEWKELDKAGALVSTSQVAWWVEDGALSFEAKTFLENGNEMVLKFPLLKGGAKKGDTWTGGGFEYLHEGTMELKLPAGEWKNAVKVVMKGGAPDSPVKIEVHFVPKVGLAKVEVQDPGGAENRYELLEFKEPPK